MKYVPKKCRWLLLSFVVFVVLVLAELTTTTTNTKSMMTLAFTGTVTKPMRTKRTTTTTTTTTTASSITTSSRSPILVIHHQQQYRSVTQQSFLQVVGGINNDGDQLDDYSNNKIPENALIEKSNDSNATNNNKLDTILSKLTTMFPFFVLCAAIIGILQPHYLLWINNGSIISYMLALVMCGTGLTLQLSDFTYILQSSKNISSIPLGILCQFCIMPITSFIIGLFLLYYPYSSSAGVLSSLPSSYGYDLFIGLILVGCAPGGTASNLVTLIANANVALSVLLTTCSTILAVVVTPFLVTLSVSLLQKLISFQSTTATTATATVAAKALSSTASKSIARASTSTGSSLPIQISGSTLCMATAKVVFIPILIGMTVRGQFPFLATFISRFTPFASVLLVSLLCGGVVAQNVQMLQSTTTTTSASAIGSSSSSSNIIQSILISVLLVHTIGFITGYIIPKFGFQQNESTSRTISIEVGMQNSALAVVLAKSIPGLHPIATLPGAFSATVHSCLGSILATIWRRQSVKLEAKKQTQNKVNSVTQANK